MYGVHMDRNVLVEIWSYKLYIDFSIEIIM